jgi:hypothetical protein
MEIPKEIQPSRISSSLTLNQIKAQLEKSNQSIKKSFLTHSQ